MTVKYSLQNLHEAPRRVRDMTDEELKTYHVGFYKVQMVARGAGRTLLESLAYRVEIPSHTVEADIQDEIDRQVKIQAQNFQAAKDRAQIENARRRDVMFEKAGRRLRTTRY